VSKRQGRVPQRYGVGLDPSPSGPVPPLLEELSRRFVQSYRQAVAQDAADPAVPRRTSAPTASAAAAEEAYLEQRCYQVPVPTPETMAGPVRVSALDRLADEAESYRDPLLDRFGEHLRRLARWNDALISADADAVTRASTSLYGELAPETILRAEELLHSTNYSKDHDTATLDSTATAKVFTGLLALVAATGWLVQTEEGLRARVAVRPASRTLVLRQGEQFSVAEVKRLAVHEIGTHVLRAHLGSMQRLDIYGLGFGPRSMCVEEGLAVWAEQRAGLLDMVTSRRYAVRVLAVRDALVAPFGVVYNNARTHCSPREAFEVASRVKRGIGDWNLPGAHVKDKVYLEGLDLVTPVLGDRDMRRALWAGKVSDLDSRELSQLVGFTPLFDDPLDLHHHIVDHVDSTVGN
jgi:hypothetical protein